MIIAGPRLRAQAAARTSLHLANHDNEAYAVAKAVRNSCKSNYTSKQYVSEERARLEIIRGIGA